MFYYETEFKARQFGSYSIIWSYCFFQTNRGSALTKPTLGKNSVVCRMNRKMHRSMQKRFMWRITHRVASLLISALKNREIVKNRISIYLRLTCHMFWDSCGEYFNINHVINLYSSSWRWILISRFIFNMRTTSNNVSSQ